MSLRGLVLLAFVLVSPLGLLFDPLVEGQEIVWIRQFGTSSFDTAGAVSADPSGVYVGGSTSGVFSGQSFVGGTTDAFLRKYDFNSNEIWTRQFGSAANEGLLSISTGPSGVYVTGKILWDALPGQTSSGSADAFVQKYDPDGNEVWTRQFGTLGFDDGYVSVHSSGVYVTGVVEGTLPGQTSAGAFDGYVRKYDFDGNEVWTRQFGTSADDGATSIAVDSSGVYIAGLTYAALPGKTYFGGLYDVFARKYDFEGNEVWTDQFGTLGSEEALAVAVDSSGVYVAGWTNGELPDQTSGRVGSPDAFVRKYDKDGNELWTRQSGVSEADRALAASADSSGVYVAGIQTFRTQDGVIRKYSQEGNEMWTRQFGSDGLDWAESIFSGSGRVIVAGSTYGAMPGQSNLGDSDAFVATFEKADLPLSINIDIKPGSDPNSVNVKSQGVVPVAILTDSAFDASTVDASTLRFGRSGMEAAPAVVPSSLSDVDGDGDLDMVLLFNAQDTGFKAGDTIGILTGRTLNGTAIAGTDSVRAFFPGDVNGDLVVNVLDLVVVGGAFGSTPDSPNWNLYADFSEDGIINILDLVVVGAYFGQYA